MMETEQHGQACSRKKKKNMAHLGNNEWFRVVTEVSLSNCLMSNTLID